MLIGAALALIGIGYLITGKSRILPGACGRVPQKKRDKGCGGNEMTCDLCKTDADNESGKTDDDNESKDPVQKK